MNLKAIRQVIESDLPDEEKEGAIIKILAEDKNVIPLVMEILEAEREKKSELISDMNAELSRAHIFLEATPPNSKIKIVLI